MKYFIDMKFIEGFHKPLFGKQRHFIDLISLGMVSEDNREFYQISSEYRYNDASEWVKQNVIAPMYADLVHGDQRNRFGVNDFHKYYGGKNEQIAMDAAVFCGCKINYFKPQYPKAILYDRYFCDDPDIQFYGYFSDYDWVLFCSLFGRMIDLPKGFPMHCIDLKQMMDHESINDPRMISLGSRINPRKTMLDIYRANCNFPKQMDEHNALADARWNKQLYEYICSQSAGVVF